MFTALLRTPDLTVGQWTCQVHGTGWSDPERVDQPEVVIPVSGAYIRERGARETVATPNVALFGNAGDGYRVRHPAGQSPDRCAALMLNQRSLEELTATVGGLGQRKARLPSGAVPVPAREFLQTCRLLRSDPADRLRVHELSASLLVSLVSRGARRPPVRDSRQRRAVTRALDFILAGYRKPLALDDIAAAAGYSPFHFARMFRDEVGMPAYRYVLQLRLRAALDAVLDGADDLSRLALRLGFSSHSHLTVAFRRAFGHPPSAFRTGLNPPPPEA